MTKNTLTLRTLGNRITKLEDTVNSILQSLNPENQKIESKKKLTLENLNDRLNIISDVVNQIVDILNASAEQEIQKLKEDISDIKEFVGMTTFKKLSFSICLKGADIDFINFENNSLDERVYQLKEVVDKLRMNMQMILSSHYYMQGE